MLPVSLMIIAVVLFRCAVGASENETLRLLANFSPLAAMALASGAYFPRKWAFFVPVITQVLSEIGLCLVSPTYSFSLAYSLVLVVAYAAIVVVGLAVKKRFTPIKLLGASIIGTLLFYVVTNTTSFWQDPAYVKNFSGWVQSLTVGRPEYPPTYLFLFKSMAGDLLFSSLILLAAGAGKKHQESIAEESEPEPDAEPAEA